MNTDFLIKSTALVSEDSAASERPPSDGSVVTRRRFLKRAGGATIAAAAVWSMSTKSASAEEEGGSWKMKCSAPPATIPSQVSTPIAIPQASGPDVNFVLRFDLTVTKFADAPTSGGYNYCAFGGNIAVDAFAGGALVDFATYVIDYDVYCDADSGDISASMGTQPWTTRVLGPFTVGTTAVSAFLEIYSPEIVGSNINTGVRFHVAYQKAGASTATSMFFTPNHFKITNSFFAFEE